MIQDIQIAFWLLLPAAFANAAPIFSATVPYFRRWNTPLDFGRTYRGKEIFGANKTWRGLLTGIIVATIILWLQKISVAHTGWDHAVGHGVDYAHLPTLILGPLFGLGALGADAIESFFKRLRGIRPGRSWAPFDQLDYVIGGILVSLLFVRLHFSAYLWMVAIWFTVHLLASYIGWQVGLKKRPI
ncbi:CDP-archaeol synthase [Polaromonas sp.]|nr:CDP-archaeol synthase [Candidatus Saccharibacteria bacterium]